MSKLNPSSTLEEVEARLEEQEKEFNEFCDNVSQTEIKYDEGRLMSQDEEFKKYMRLWNSAKESEKFYKERIEIRLAELKVTNWTIAEVLKEYRE